MFFFMQFVQTHIHTNRVIQKLSLKFREVIENMSENRFLKGKYVRKCHLHEQIRKVKQTQRNDTVKY